MIEQKVWNDAFKKYFDESKFEGVDEKQKAFMIGYLVCADHFKAFELMDLIQRLLQFGNTDSELIEDCNRALKKIDKNKTSPFVAVTKPFRNKPYYSKKTT